jgi:hypothetical protein
VDNEVEVIDKHPFGALIALEVRRAHVFGFERLFDGIGNGMDLPRVRAGANQKVVGERASLPEVEHDKVGRLFVARRRDRGL